MFNYLFIRPEGDCLEDHFVSMWLGGWPRSLILIGYKKPTTSTYCTVHIFCTNCTQNLKCFFIVLNFFYSNHHFFYYPQAQKPKPPLKPIRHEWWYYPTPMPFRYAFKRS